MDGTLGRFKLLDTIGRGTSSVVYRAHDTLLDREVALKVVTVENDENAAARLHSEALIGQELRHPHIVTVFGIERLSGTNAAALVMEYIRGESLRERLIRNGPSTDEGDIVSILLPVAEALEHAHSRGVIHRDIKPSNILLGEEGSVKLADFGVARSVLARESITRTGEHVGTVGYMAPEIIGGGGATEQSDIYSFGMIARELLTGTPAVDLVRIAGGGRQPALPRTAPGWVARLVRDSTEPNLEDRIATASELVTRIRAAGGNASRPLARKVRRLMIWGASAVVLVCAVTQYSDRALIEVGTPLARIIGRDASAKLSRLPLRLFNPAAVAAALLSGGQDEEFERAYEALSSDERSDPRLPCASIKFGRTEVLRRLLDRGVDTETSCKLEGYRFPTLLGAAIARHRPEIVTLLLDRGASFEGTPGDPHAPFGYLVREGDAEVVRAFFAHDRIRSRPVLGDRHMLSTLLHDRRAKMLVGAFARSGANPEARVDQGYTALHVEAALCDASGIELLLALGLSVRTQAQDGATPLLSACMDSTRDPLPVLRALVDAGSDINEVNARGSSLLMRAAGEQHDRLVAALLENYPVDVNRRDNNGNTPLMYAVGGYKGDPSTVKLLLAHGADPSVRNFENLSPADNARGRGHQNLVPLLESGSLSLDSGTPGSS